MQGSPIQQALEAALFFVKDLPSTANATFNVAVFGSTHAMLWPGSKFVDLFYKYTQKKKKKRDTPIGVD